MTTNFTVSGLESPRHMGEPAFCRCRWRRRGHSRRRGYGTLVAALLIALVELSLPLREAPTREVPFAVGSVVDGNFNGASSVCMADLDGDGDLDIVGAAQDGDQLAWWENTTSGGASWTKHVIQEGFDGARFVRVADMDGDGNLDVLAVAPWADEVAWWENSSGAGTTWTKHGIDAAFDGAVCVQPVDMDSDGDLDVIGAAWYGDTVVWWENANGSGILWTKHTVDASFHQVNFVMAGDVDGDGDWDILGAAQVDNEIAWWENLDGRGATWRKHLVASNFDIASCVHAADMDGDGDLDILGAAYSANTIAWWENRNGSGTSWTEHIVDAAFPGAHDVVALDLDGDGDRDVLGASIEANTVFWWENNNRVGTSWTRHTVGSYNGAWCAYAADVDGDGDQDVLAAGRAASTIMWWKNKTIHRSAIFSFKHPVDANFDSVYSIYGADMDSDGDVDVVAAARFNGIAWWHNVAHKGLSWTKQTVVDPLQDARSIHVADVDGDGDQDIIGALYATGTIAWWENVGGHGTSWAVHPVDGAFGGARSVCAADMDGDGDLDILGAAYSANAIAWWENTNRLGTAWAKHTVDGAFGGAHCVQAADMDGDGDLDVLGAAYLDSDITWWENTNGTGTVWAEHTVDGFFGNAAAVLAADMDGDGDLDILGAAYLDNDITWWENANGAGTVWAEHTVDGDFIGAQSVWAADMDGDGDLDVLGAAYLDNDITWWENTNGTGTAWTKHTVETSFGGAFCVHAVDVDNDGDLDILAGGNLADTVAWWENRGGQFALATTNTAPATIFAGQTDDVLKVVAFHRGRSTDTDMELASFELRFEDSTGRPLTSSQANAIIENLHIYADNGSGVFERASDTLVATVATLNLTSGTQTVTFTDGDPNVRVVHGTPRTFFVVVQLTVAAGSQNPNCFRVAHITNSTSTADDRDYDIGLTLEYTPNTTSSIVRAIGSSRVNAWPRYH